MPPSDFAKANIDEVVEQPGQLDLRHVDEEIGVLGGPLPTSKRDGKATDEGMTDRSGGEHLREEFDRSVQVVLEEVAIKCHDA